MVGHLRRVGVLVLTAFQRDTVSTVGAHEFGSADPIAGIKQSRGKRMAAIATALDAPGICFHPSVNQAARTQVRNELGFLSRQLERLKLIRVVHWSKHRKGLSCGVERMQVEENVMRGE